MRRSLHLLSANPMSLDGVLVMKGNTLCWRGNEMKRLITNRQSETARKCSPMGKFSGPRSPDIITYNFYLDNVGKTLHPSWNYQTDTYQHETASFTPPSYSKYAAHLCLTFDIGMIMTDSRNSQLPEMSELKMHMYIQNSTLPQPILNLCEKI